MKPFRPVRLLVVTLSALLATATWSADAPAGSPPGPPPATMMGPPTSLDATARTSIVNAAADALTRRYVYPDVGRRAAAAIKSALAAGSYDAISEPRAFADRLTADITAIAHDKHLRVSVFGSPPAAGGAPMPARPRAEAGVVRADRLPGNIGYIEISGFPPLQSAKAPFDRAMAPLADTRALIIDIRRNGGGSPDSEVYLASYFLDPAKPVIVSRLICAHAGHRNLYYAGLPQLCHAVLLRRQARVRADQSIHFLRW